MSMLLKPGTRVFSAVCPTEMITVKAPAVPVDLTIGGAAAVVSAAERTGDGAVMPGHGGGSAMGKRYVDTDGVIELLCTKSGDGLPAVGGSLLELKEAKPLPASD